MRQGAALDVAARPRWPRAWASRIAGRLRLERTTPGRLAWAVAVGVLVGTTPLYGFHLGITIVLAALFGLNPVITYLAANYALPVVAPFLAFGSVQIGSLLLTGGFVTLHASAFRDFDFWILGKAWLLGSVVLGSMLAAPAGLATFFAMRAYRRRRPLPADPVGDSMEAAAARYRSEGRWTFGYVKGKFRRDPVYRQLAERCPLPAPLVDVGCGRGQAAVLLALAQPGLAGVGLDWDLRKIECARRAAEGIAGLRFEASDVRQDDFPAAGTLLLIDVLHYSPPEVQDRMIARAARSLAPGGVLYVREADGAAGWRVRPHRWMELLGRWVRLNRSETICMRPVAELLGVIERAGLETRVTPSADLPFANVLIEARRVRPAS